MQVNRKDLDESRGGVMIKINEEELKSIIRNQF